MGLRRGEAPAMDISDRFRITQDGPMPGDIRERQRIQTLVRDHIVTMAEDLADNIEPSRELSLAITHLEEALMWAGKAIFR